MDQQCSFDSTQNHEKVIRLDTAEGPVFAKHVVFAVPPKLIAKHIQFEPALSSGKVEAMKASNTWMAGVTKVSLVYDSKFWTDDISNMGLPRSQPGPAFQMYDASTKDGAVHAITFFTLVPPGSPAKTHAKVLGDQVASQVANVWNMYMGRGDLKQKILDYKDVRSTLAQRKVYFRRSQSYPNSSTSIPCECSCNDRMEWPSSFRW